MWQSLTAGPHDGNVAAPDAQAFAAELSETARESEDTPQTAANQLSAPKFVAEPH
jgi:hypothetical protein